MSDVRSNEELTEVAATGLRWITIARVVTELLLVASMIVLARLIPPAAFGMFAIAVIVQELAINVPSEAVGSALVQRKTVAREHLQGGFALALACGAVLTAVALSLTLLVIRPVFGAGTADVFLLTAPWFLLGAIAAVPLAILRRRLDFRRLSLLALTQSLVRSLGSVFLAAVFGLDAGALVLGGLAGIAAMVALALRFAPPPLPRWRREAIRDLLPYGVPAALACFSWVGFRNGDYAIVGAKLGTAQAGFYYRGFQLAVEYQGKISQMMVQMAFPVLARTTDVDAMFALRRRMVRLLTVVVFPALLMLAILAPVLVPWLFGPAWEPAVLPTQILAGAGAATVVIDAVGTVLMARGRTRAMLGYGVAHFVVYVGAVLIFARYGLGAVAGAAVGVHLVFVVVAYQLLLHDRPEKTLRFLWSDISAATVSCWGLAACAVPLDRALAGVDTAPVLHLAVVAAAGAAGYLAVLRIRFPDDARQLMSLVRRVLPIGRLQARIRRAPALAGRSS